LPHTIISGRCRRQPEFHDRVVALPSMGSATIAGRIYMGEKVITGIKTFLDGHKPPERVPAAMF
jgi:glyoxylate reductase